MVNWAYKGENKNNNDNDKFWIGDSNSNLRSLVVVGIMLICILVPLAKLVLVWSQTYTQLKNRLV